LTVLRSLADSLMSPLYF